MSRAGAINPDSEAVLDSPMGEADGIDFKIIELLFFVYRDFTSDPDAILNTLGFGRAHHRVVHFVNREPGAGTGKATVSPHRPCTAKP